MPHRLLSALADGPFGNLLMVLGGGLAALAGSVHALFAQATGIESIPGYVTALAIIGGLVTAVSPLVLRVVDLTRLRQALRQARHYLKNVEQQRDIVAAENRRLRDWAVKQAVAKDLDLPDWFYADPAPTPGTGDFPLILPDSDDTIPTRDDPKPGEQAEPPGDGPR